MSAYSLPLFLFFFSVRFLSLSFADGTLNKGTVQANSKFGPAQKVTFEDNFQQKTPISTQRHGQPFQKVPPFEDGFAVPFSAHFAAQKPHEKSSQLANSHSINNNQSLARPYNCSGKKDGIYLEKDGTCSATFWGCSQGKAFPYGCPRGLFFNTENGKCDRSSEIVACGGRPQNPSPSAVGTFASFNCSAQRDGLHALRHCVSDVFFACLGGRAVALSVCSSGLKFDQQKGECAFADQCGKERRDLKQTETEPMGANLEHGTSNYYFRNDEYEQRQEKVSSENTFFCPDKRNDTYAKSFCTSSFFKCTNGVANETKCSANLVYDAKWKQCTTQQNCWQNSTNWTGKAQQNVQNPMAPYHQPQTQAGVPYPSAHPMEFQSQPTTHPMAFLPQPTPMAPNVPLPPSPVAFDCVGKSDGNYVHRPCQPIYLVCSNNAPVQMNCPANLVFDPTTKACEYSERCTKNNAPGASRPPSPAPPSSVGVTPRPPSPSHSLSSSIHLPSPAQIGHFNCSAKSNGHYGQGHCQSEFVACFNGSANPQKCQDGLVFDDTKGRCEQPQHCGKTGAFPPPNSRPFERNDSPSLSSPPPTRRPFVSLSSFRCVGRVDGYYFKKPCATHFYTCVGGHPTQLTCPDNLVFDPSRALCQYPQMCNNSTNVSGKPTTPGAMPPSADPPQPPPPTTGFPCEDKLNGYYVRQPCTGHFYTCLGGKATKLACPGKLVFEMKSLSCQYAENCAVESASISPSPSTVSGYSHNQLVVHQSPQFESVRHSPQISNASVTQWHPPPPPQYGQRSPPLPPPTSTPFGLPTTAPQFHRYNTSLPPQAQNGRRLPPRPAHQLLFSPSIDHSPSGGFCAAFRKSDGLYAVPNGCDSHFYACTAGITTKMDCPLGLFYDAELRQCNHRENVASCGGGQQRKSQKIVPSPAEFRSANFDNAPSVLSSISSNFSSSPQFNCSDRAIGYYSGGCNSIYFSCTGLNTYSFTCPALLKYSELVGQCDYANNVPECGGTVPAPPPPPVYAPPKDQQQTNGQGNANGTQKNPSKHPQHPANNPCGQLPNGTYGPKCSPYYLLCSDGVPHDFLCQDEFVFHSPIGKSMDHSHGHHANGPSEHRHATAHGEGTQMSMHAMFFHFGVTETVLFGFWHTNSAFGLFLSCLAVIAFCFALEFVRWFRLNRKSAVFRASSSRQSSSDQLTNGGQADAEIARRMRFFALSADASLHAVQLTLSYLLMLIFMTFNVWLCFAVVFGEVCARLMLALFFPQLDLVNAILNSATGEPCCG
ncbi:hypothetical protein niasHT_015712 [Heterodera trifolii]|uniref:Chitin-binding type-2 domain-containing protein n=1 Tax=Heterodera trifolii TaxID=157864 RepID=A0ABD2L6N0_9BILA